MALSFSPSPSEVSGMFVAKSEMQGQSGIRWDILLTPFVEQCQISVSVFTSKSSSSPKRLTDSSH